MRNIICNKSNSVIKLRYVMSTCIPEPYDDIRKQIYEVFSDGRVRHYIYNNDNNKATQKEKFHIPFAEAKSLLSDMENYMKPENFQNPEEFAVIDNRWYELTMTFDCGEKASCDGTFGGGQIERRMQMFIDMLVERYSDATKRDYKVCPYCGSDRVIPIVYGFPSMELFQEEEKGNVKLGGCMVSMDGSDRRAYCKDCGTSWSDDMLTVDHMKKIRFIIETCGLEPTEMHEKHVYEIYPNGTVKYSLYVGYKKKPFCKESYSLESMKVINLFADLRRYSRSDYKELLRESYCCDGSMDQLQIYFIDGTILKYNGFCCGGTFGERMLKFFRDCKMSGYEDL